MWVAVGQQDDNTGQCQQMIVIQHTAGEEVVTSGWAGLLSKFL